MSDPLFTPRFFTMCAFSAMVFVSVFQLLPAAPYRVLELGGTAAAAGLFLGLLAYASALSAPITGPIGDRLGHRRVLIAVSLTLALFSASYAVISDHRLMLAVVAVHGLFWSALLSSSGAYMTATIPASRRAEGLSYWGLTSILALGAAPALGFWVHRFGWATLCLEITALNLIMAVIAWRLPDDRDPGGFAPADPPTPSLAGAPQSPLRSGELTRAARSPDTRDFATRLFQLVEWRVLLLSIAMAMISFGYGSLTSFSALFADALHVTPRSLFLTAMAVSVCAGRILIGRTLDRIGYRRVLLPCLLAPPVGLLILAGAQGRLTFLIAALVFGAGFGLMYPSYTAYVLQHVPANRRGAAFGAMLAAFDTGIGTGSTAMGWLVHHYSFRVGFVVAAGLAALSLPYFLVAERTIWGKK
ncbi:MAG TPA: MFS transporter [Vicinamibacterales bacterium]|nr:MFS transporter [Vicinamibacterales bacterium]